MAAIGPEEWALSPALRWANGTPEHRLPQLEAWQDDCGWTRLTGQRLGAWHSTGPLQPNLKLSSDLQRDLVRLGPGGGRAPLHWHFGTDSATDSGRALALSLPAPEEVGQDQSVNSGDVQAGG